MLFAVNVIMPCEVFLVSEEASPSIGNTLWCVSTMFMCSAITLPEVNGLG